MSKTNGSKENLEKIVKESYSIADVLRNLNLKVAGGNYNNAGKHIHDYNLDTSHFTGQIGSKSPLFKSEDKKLVSLNEILQDNTNFKSSVLKERLIQEGIKDNKCEICGISKGNDKDITLELHHINGNHYDNRLENLQILCPNCHSQTNTYRKRIAIRKDVEAIPDGVVPPPLSNKSKIKEKVCPICGVVFKPDRNSQKYCSVECARKASKSTFDLSKEQIEKVIDQFSSITELAKYFNISRPTMRKYLEQYDLLDLVKAKFDFRARPVIQYDLNNNTIKEGPSISDAETTLKITSIEKCCKFKRKSAGGFIGRYKNTE